MSSDATRCAKCGGEFGTKRIHIDGSQYHPSCAVMSYPSHTPDDLVRATAEIDQLREACRAAHGVLTALVDPNPQESALHIFSHAVIAEAKVRAALGIHKRESE